MTDWNARLQAWIKPASDNEEAKRDTTEDEIRQALADYEQLPNSSMRVFAQGSYKNRTNVRLLSDVDIGVEYQEGEAYPTTTPSIATTQKSFSAKDLSDEQLGLSDKGSYDPKQVKDHVQAAMEAAFGSENVERKNKAIRIKQGPTTLPADVVPCVPHRRYDSELTVNRGVRIFPDSGSAIENYPQQHYDNGVAKNNRTSRRYKRMVRAFKRMSFHLSESEEPRIPSFVTECILHNVPDDKFVSSDYLDMIRSIAEWAWFQTYDQERCDDWHEVNELKYLFRGTHQDLREPASDFLWETWKLVENA
jgi:hypothetical protein